MPLITSLHTNVNPVNKPSGDGLHISFENHAKSNLYYIYGENASGKSVTISLLYCLTSQKIDDHNYLRLLDDCKGTKVTYNDGSTASHIISVEEVTKTKGGWTQKSVFRVHTVINSLSDEMTVAKIDDKYYEYDSVSFFRRKPLSERVCEKDNVEQPIKSKFLPLLEKDYCCIIRHNDFHCGKSIKSIQEALLIDEICPIVNELFSRIFSIERLKNISDKTETVIDMLSDGEIKILHILTSLAKGILSKKDFILLVDNFHGFMSMRIEVNAVRVLYEVCKEHPNLQIFLVGFTPFDETILPLQNQIEMKLR